ncbi:hypothetical protein CCACVL1_05414 [Corchorus capsularis]|uniref:Uncharacterized protein n=1 Tax=Corchorus capsularis TaxID=210143 RepID=A0A1R3JKR7_COCAP|nr:hypothetical protein CCACVL1_05414 [Corchorus capsularis]
MAEGEGKAMFSRRRPSFEQRGEKEKGE